MHTKMLAFLGSFVVLTVKFLLYKKWQRKYGPPLCAPFSIERSAATTLFQPLLRLLTALFPAALLTLRGGRWAGRYWEPTLEGTPSEAAVAAMTVEVSWSCQSSGILPQSVRIRSL